MRGIKTLTTQLSSNEIGFPIAHRSITRESVDDLQIPFRLLRHRKLRNRDGQMDNARLLAQIRLWVPMKRTWPGFGTIFSRLHMKTAIGKKAGSHVR